MGIGQNRNLGNLGNFPFCSKSCWNLLVFFSIDLFGSFKCWITISVIIWGKRNFQDFRVFNLGYRTKSKTRKSRRFLFFLFEKLNHSNEPSYRTVSILPLVSNKFEKLSKPATVWIPYSNIPYSDFYKNVKRALLRGVYWYNFNRRLKSLWLLTAWFI